MANMLMDGDLVSVAYQNDSHFPGLVMATLGRKALIESLENACIMEFTCMDGTRWHDEKGQIARIACVTVDQIEASLEVRA